MWDGMEKKKKKKKKKNAFVSYNYVLPLFTAYIIFKRYSAVTKHEIVNRNREIKHGLNNFAGSCVETNIPVSILHKSIAGRYRPVSYVSILHKSIAGRYRPVSYVSPL